MKFYNWDTDARGHMWSYETPDGAWVSRTAAEALAAELAAMTNDRNYHRGACMTHCMRIRDLESALREIARRESEAREIVTQNRWPSTLAIDLASQARLALETKAKELDCRHGIPRSLCSECPTSDRGEKR